MRSKVSHLLDCVLICKHFCASRCFDYGRFLDVHVIRRLEKFERAVAGLWSASTITNGIWSKSRVEVLWMLRNKVRSTGSLCCLQDRLFFLLSVVSTCAESNVVAQCQREQLDLLRQYAESFRDIAQVVFLDVTVVQEILSAVQVEDAAYVDK